MGGRSTVEQDFAVTEMLVFLQTHQEMKIIVIQPQRSQKWEDNSYIRNLMIAMINWFYSPTVDRW